MPHADMTVSIDDVLDRENPVRDNQIAMRLIKIAH
jgi:hypothetical protein